MTNTFYGLDQLGTPVAFFAALVIGVAFGFVLERAGFGSARRIAGVFYFKDMTVVKVMFAAMLTAMIGIAMFVGVGWIHIEQIHLMPTVYGAHVVGGVLFGIGFVMSGWCPGTSAVGVASGKLDALFFLVGIAIGAFAFNEAFVWIKPLYNWGLQSEPMFAFGIPTTVFAFLFSVAGVGAFYFSEWIERRMGGEGRYLRSPLLKAFSLAMVAAAAALFILPTEPGAASAERFTASSDSDLALLEEIEAGADHIEPEELADRLVRGDPTLLVVDVRPESEYLRFHIRGAVNVPMVELFDDLKPYQSFDAIMLYSNGMTHPAQARDLLTLRGFTNVYLLTDGLQGFLDRCIRPVSVRDEPVAEEVADRVSQWRRYFLADTSCPPNSFTELTAKQLEPVNCGSIEPLHTVNGIFLSAQPLPDDFRLAKQTGINTVISLRFNDELDWDEATLMDELGLEYYNIPFKAPETLTDEVFTKVRALLNGKGERPILLHCSSANRVGAIWLAHRALDHGLSIEEAEQEAKTVGLKLPAYTDIAKDYVNRMQEKRP